MAFFTLIKQETEQDREEVQSVVRKASLYSRNSNQNEHNLVDKLRKSESFIPELSLIAMRNHKIVGHALFVVEKLGKHKIVALKSLCVIPKFRLQGIGGMLMLEGHNIARDLGYKAIVAPNHDNYFSRFGYAPMNESDIKPLIYNL